MRSRLKSLELHGYKTFASRAVFEFPGEVTAIVGPNGSGKSNIADAIRWVLGEQTFSLLRAKKTEDMIFSGSEQRPRASMASATVLFDNEEGWLPIDFSEVTITRRAYRDGDNEYLLNNQRVRLKEINELLSQSGLSERTYTVIGQGLVDAALSLKPEERRKFFEEAAGIGLYRGRREEALNRLESTRRNLERVHDILGELGPRLQGLERQAKRAQEYERIKADLRLLLRDWYGFHWHQSQNELVHAREAARIQDQQLTAAREKQTAIDGQVDSIRGRVQEIRAKLSLLHEQSAGLHTKWEETNKNLAVLDEREKAFQKQMENLIEEKTRSDGEISTSKLQVDALQSELERLNVELQEFKDQADAVNKDLASRQSVRAKKELEIENRREQLTSAETRLIKMKAHIDELSQRLKTHQDNLDNFRVEKEKIEQILNSTLMEFQSAEGLVAKNEKELQEKLTLKSKLEDKSIKLNDELHNTQQKIAKSQGELARMIAQKDILDQSEKNLLGLMDGSKSVLKAAEAGEISGTYTQLSKEIQVKKEFEIAIGSVMGEIIEAILLGKNTDPDRVLTFLSGGDRGRAILIRMGYKTHFDEIKIPKDGGIICKAIDTIKVDAELEETLRLLFQGVFIVNDIEVGKRLQSKIPLNCRLVTLNGEIFAGNGSIIVGRENRAALLSRPRQKHEIAIEIQSKEKVHLQLESDLANKQNEIDSNTQAISDLTNEIKILQNEVNDSRTSYQRLNLELEQTRQKYDWCEQQISFLVNQIKDVSAIRDQSSNDIAPSEEEIKALRKSVNDLGGGLRGFSLEELQASSSHWAMQVAVSERGIEEIQNRLDERRELNSAAQKRFDETQKRIDEMNSMMLHTGEEKRNLIESENSLSGEVKSIQEKIQPLESELSEKETEFNSLQETQISLRQTLSVVERHAAQAQMDLNRQKDNLDSLRRKIEEDFGLVAFEYNQELAGPTPLPLEGMVEQLPVILELPKEYEENINRQRAQLRRMGPVNLEAQKEYQEVFERFTFLNGQVDDLKKADADLRQVIAELDELMKVEFRKTFDLVAVEFKQMFTRLFGGGSAKLELVDEDNPSDSGVDIEARLPGRREQGLALLSGGERSLTAVALVFALLKIAPTPFCILDEVDAMLDEANVGRFTELLQELSQKTQFILITHNRNTVQVAGVIYGVTMGKDSASQVISLKMDEITDEMVK